MTARSGLEAAPANLSAQRAKGKEPLIPATYGLCGSGSSASIALSQFLANKLAMQFATGGSILFRQTWKVLTTPLGRQLWAHIASVRRTSGSGFTSWPTPNHNPTGARSQGRNGGLNLQTAVLVAGWPTPTKGNADGSQMAKDASATGKRPNGSKATVSLNQVATLASWATPNARDWRSNEAGEEHHAARWAQTRGKPLSEQTHQLVSGPTANGFHASMGKRGRLNPAFSRWLMGLPLEWDACAPTETVSSLRRRRDLFKPT